MGGFSIPGPIIRFTFDESDFTAQVKAILANASQQVTAQNKQLSQSVTSQAVNPLIAQAAQLRALYSTGSIALKDLQTQQRTLVGLLDTQIKQLATQDALTKSQLTTLKQLTLERERQQNALNRGVGVGITAGTSSALSSVSGPIIANISRLSAGLLGVAGGSGGGGGAAFNIAASGIASIASSGGVATAVIGGLTIALLAAGGAAVSMAIAGGELVLELSNISQRTGISIQNLQVLGAVASVSNLSLQDVVVGFRKFSQALTGGDGLDDGTGVTGATKKASEILQVLGVTSKDSFTAIEQVADAFQKLPDGALKGTAAVQLFGKSGLNLIPILEQGRAGVEQFRAIVEQFGPSIDQNGVKAQQDWKIATTELSLAFDSLKVSAIPVLGILTQLTSSSAALLKVTSDNPGGATTKSILSGFILGGAGIGSISAISGNLAELNSAAAKTGPSLDQAFKIGEDAAKRFGPNVKALTDLLNGTADALKKLKEEGAKELQALTDEAGKSAVGKLNTFTVTGERSDPNATASDNVLVKQRQDLEEIAQIMLNFPNLANQVQAAVAGVTNKTIDDLTKLADAALKKADEADAAELAQKIKNERELNALILGADDDLAVERAKAAKDAVTEIIKAEQKRLDDQLAKYTLLGASEQQLQDLRVKAVQDAQLKIAKLRQDELDKTRKGVEQQAGQLFDALLKGGGNFTAAVKTSLENILLAPVKSVFSSVIGGVLTGPVQAGKDIITNFGRQLQKDNPTGVLNSVGRGLAPSSAIGNNTDALTTNTQALLSLTSRIGGGTGAGGSSGGPLGSLGLGGGTFNPLTDQLPLGDVGTQISNLSGGVESLPLPLGNVSQELANLTGVLSGTNTAASTGPNALGTIFQNLTNVLTGTSPGTAPGAGVGLFGGGTGLILHGFGGSSSGTAGVTSALSSPLLGLLGGGVNAIAGLTGHNVIQSAGGLATLGGGALSQLGKSQGNAGLSEAGGILGGAGLVVSGVSQGGVGGVVSATLGGAEIGTAIAPGIGTAIGAAAGFTAGLLGAIFGHHGFTPQQIAAAGKRQTVDPNLFVGQEFDRSAQGTFGDTLNTTFSEGPGGTFSSSKIKGPGSPGNVTFNITALDAKSVVDVFNQHGATMAKIVAGKINSTQSGLANSIRTAVAPA